MKLSAIIVTEGWHDVLIIDALLRRRGWSPQKKNKEKILEFKDKEKGKVYTIQIFPSRVDEGGKDYIPQLISWNWINSDLFIVMFDPDDQNPVSEIQKLYDRIEKHIQSRSQKKLSDNKYIVQDQSGREVMLAFWPAMVDISQWPRSIRGLILAHNLAYNMLDYVLVMGMRDDILRKAANSFSGARSAERVPADKFPKKLKEILRLLRRQGIQLMSSKRVLDFYAALLGFRGGFGHLGVKIIEEMPENDLDIVFGGFPSFIINLLNNFYRQN